MKHGLLAFALVMSAACGGDDDFGDGVRADARPLSDGGGGGGGDDGGVTPDAGGGDVTPLVWAWGDFATNNRTQLAAFAPDSALPVTPLAVFPAGDTGQIWSQSGSADYGPFDISGSRVAFSADIDMATRYDLYVASVDGGEPVHVVAVGDAADIEKVRFSPDGSKIAFIADLELDGQLDAYVIASDAALGTPVRVSPAHASASTDLDASQLAWSTDSQKIVVTGDFSQNDYQEMWIADATAAEPTPAPVVDRDRIMSTGVGGKGAIQPLLVSGASILFKSRLDADDLFKLTVIGTDGENEATLANSTITRTDDSIADIGAATLSGDRSQIAFGADETETIFDLWVMPADGSMSPTKLTDGLANADTGPPPGQQLKWSADGQKIAFLADYRDEGRYEPYVVPVAGGGQTHLANVGDSPADNKDADAICWTPAGDALFMVADLEIGNDSDLFRLDPATADQTPGLAIGAPPDGDLGGVRSSH